MNWVVLYELKGDRKNITDVLRMDLSSNGTRIKAMKSAVTSNGTQDYDILPNFEGKCVCHVFSVFMDSDNSFYKIPNKTYIVTDLVGLADLEESLIGDFILEIYQWDPSGRANKYVKMIREY